MGLALRRLPDAEYSSLKEGAEESLSAHATGEGYELPGVAVRDGLMVGAPVPG